MSPSFINSSDSPTTLPSLLLRTRHAPVSGISWVVKVPGPRSISPQRHVAFLPAYMSTSGRIHGELLRLIFFLSNKQAEDYFASLGYQPHSQEFCHRRGVFFQQNRGTIGMACAQAVALRGAPTTARRHVAASRRPPPIHMAYDDHDRNVSHIHGFA